MVGVALRHGKGGGSLSGGCLADRYWVVMALVGEFLAMPRAERCRCLGGSLTQGGITGGGLMARASEAARAAVGSAQETLHRAKEAVTTHHMTTHTTTGITGQQQQQGPAAGGSGRVAAVVERGRDLVGRAGEQTGHVAHVTAEAAVGAAASVKEGARRAVQGVRGAAQHVTGA